MTERFLRLRRHTIEMTNNVDIWEEVGRMIESHDRLAIDLADVLKTVQLLLIVAEGDAESKPEAINAANYVLAKAQKD